MNKRLLALSLILIIITLIASIFFHSGDNFVNLFSTKVKNEEMMEHGKHLQAEVVGKSQDHNSSSGMTMYPTGANGVMMMIPTSSTSTSNFIIVEINEERFSFKVNKEEYMSVVEGDFVDVTVYENELHLTARLR